MAEQKDKSRHHHGNLRQALVDAGVELLNEGGLGVLTLRQCAARAGVSHAAPAHHFGNLDGLRRAIADEGFARFEARMRDFADVGAQDPRARLRGIARGYMAFAAEEPALYDLIFSFRPKSVTDNALAQHGVSAYQLLRDTCAPFVPDGVDPVVIETQVWSLVHGFALLIMTGRFEGKEPLEEVLDLLDRVGEG